MVSIPVAKARDDDVWCADSGAAPVQGAGNLTSTWHLAFSAVRMHRQERRTEALTQESSVLQLDWSSGSAQKLGSRGAQIRMLSRRSRRKPSTRGHDRTRLEGSGNWPRLGGAL